MTALVRFIWILAILVPFNAIQAQFAPLKPGFNKLEYAEMLKISSRQLDLPSERFKTPAPEYFTRNYQSKTMGLENRWELWTNATHSVAVISIRGTTQNNTSWLENFYAAMVPAIGSLHLTDSLNFNYHLSNNPKAGIHIGWLIGTGFLIQDMLPKIDSIYKKGIKNILIMGHSQGGAIAYLLSSHLAYLQETNQLPKDIQFKTYCSAAPKPGNLFYAYEYEKLMADGWGFNVVNTADWVPQCPLTVESLTDFNNTNPFINISSILKKQAFSKRVAMKYAFNQLNNPSIKTKKRYEKYLGNIAAKSIQKTLPEFAKPTYLKSFDYVRVGPTIILLANQTYYQQFPDNPEKIFTHHFIDAYLFLTNQLN